MVRLPNKVGNDFIRGLETRACVNGMTKSDVERLKNALVKKILDDETVIDVTEDGSIIADSNGMFISVNGQMLGLSVDGENVIPVTEPYLPEDENENPLAPPNDTIMTSANIAVDPRIVHTIGNETISGNKRFLGITELWGYTSHRVIVTLPTNGWACIYSSTGSYHGGVCEIFNNNNPNTSLDCRFSWRGASWIMDMYMKGTNNLLNGLLARKGTDTIEVWIQNLGTDATIVTRMIYVRNADPVPIGTIGEKPVVGDVYSAVVEAVIL